MAWQNVRALRCWSDNWTYYWDMFYNRVWNWLQTYMYIYVRCKIYCRAIPRILPLKGSVFLVVVKDTTCYVYMYMCVCAVKFWKTNPTFWLTTHTWWVPPPCPKVAKWSVSISQNWTTAGLLLARKAGGSMESTYKLCSPDTTKRLSCGVHVIGLGVVNNCTH